MSRQGRLLSGLLALVILTVATYLLLLRFDSGIVSKPADLPNVLLVSIDSLRSDHLHCYGYGRETSPVIDSLARQGALFRTVVSPTSWTLPAHITLLTSIPPEEHGVTNDNIALSGEALTLAEALRDYGYSTAGFVSGPYLMGYYGFSQGFQHYDDYTVVKSGAPSHRGITSPEITQLVSNWLIRWDRSRNHGPFFVFLHLWDVHYDYTPPPPYDSMFDPGYTGTITAENFEKGSHIQKDMDPRDLEHIIALYDGEIRFTDLYLGSVLNLLRELRLIDRTIVVVTADHGDEFFEHGNKGHRKTLYDETILVPLVIRYPPRVPSGDVIRQQVRLMDIAPTIFSLAGLSPPADFGSQRRGRLYAERDLTPLFRRPGARLPPAPAFSDLHRGEASIRTEAFKLLVRTKTPRRPGSYELYDLSSDPGERDNLFDRTRDTGDMLLKELAAWRNGWRGRSKLARRIEIGEEDMERLRGLGYIQ